MRIFFEFNNIGHFFTVPLEMSKVEGSHEARSWTAGLSLKSAHRRRSCRGSCGTYKIFYAEEETEEMVLEQWEDLKAEINAPTLRTLTFHQLWANMLVKYADEYALVLRLVVISLLIPADTSECAMPAELDGPVKPQEPDAVANNGLMANNGLIGYKADPRRANRSRCRDVTSQRWPSSRSSARWHSRMAARSAARPTGRRRCQCTSTRTSTVHL